MNKMILGVTGPAGAGKDTVGLWFEKHYNFRRYAMAYALKAGMAAMGFPEPTDRALKEQIIPGFGFTWREAAQKLGTEWGRGLDPDIWLKIAEREISRHNDSVIITDIRFENEASMIRKFGGTVLHVYGRKAALDAPNAQHASEAGVMFYPTADFMLVNDGSMEELFQQLEGFMNV